MLGAPRARTTVTWDPKAIGLDAVGEGDLKAFGNGARTHA